MADGHTSFLLSAFVNTSARRTKGFAPEAISIRSGTELSEADRES
jgi:hypothetical protein